MTIAYKFAVFHAANPHVYEQMRAFGMALLSAGHERLSISLITERVRWETAIRTAGDPFKINNNFRAHYARMLEANEPVIFGGMFATRTRSTP